MIRWIKKLLADNGSNEALDTITASITELNEAISNNDSGVQKGLRRLSLAQKQQSEAIDALTNESKLLKSTIANRHGMVLSYQQIIDTLDNLSRIAHAINNQELIAPLISRTTEDLLSHCELKSIATINQPYPSQDCEVVGAIDSHHQEAGGDVHEILQQGYRTSNGQLIRAAKVIVYRTNSQQGAMQPEEANNNVS